MSLFDEIIDAINAVIVCCLAFLIFGIGCWLLFIFVACSLLLSCIRSRLCIMLSLSLRRRGTPRTLSRHPVDDNEGASPSRGRRSPYQSLSSRKSISGLFQRRESSSSVHCSSDTSLLLTSTHRSPAKEEEANEEGHTKKRVEPHPGVRVASPSPGSLPKSSRTRSRSLSRSRSSDSISKNFFGSSIEWIAGKMKGVTELLHKDTADHEESEEKSADRVKMLADLSRSLGPATLSKTSPRKVRFKSDTLGHEQSTSSPIEIPKRSAPCLPPINLPAPPFMDAFGHTNNDPIPTARPPDTPVLTANMKDDYFSPLPPQTVGTGATISPKSSIDEGSNENPFADPIEQIASHASKSTDATTVSNHSHMPPEEGCNEPPAMSTSYESNKEDVTPRPETSLAQRDPFSDAAETDVFSQRALPKGATHEDIRHRFRARVPSCGWDSPTSDSSTANTPRESCDVAFGPPTAGGEKNGFKSGGEALISTDESGVSDVRRGLESMSLTDPIKVGQIAPS